MNETMQVFVAIVICVCCAGGFALSIHAYLNSLETEKRFKKLLKDLNNPINRETKKVIVYFDLSCQFNDHYLLSLEKAAYARGVDFIFLPQGFKIEELK